MSTFERTEEGFAAAFASAKWSAEIHKRPIALIVHKKWPDKYMTSIPILIRVEDIEPGTAANLIDGDGNMTPMFK